VDNAMGDQDSSDEEQVRTGETRCKSSLLENLICYMNLLVSSYYVEKIF
jgi:hypothetical protein